MARLTFAPGKRNGDRQTPEDPFEGGDRLSDLLPLPAERRAHERLRRALAAIARVEHELFARSVEPSARGPAGADMMAATLRLARIEAIEATGALPQDGRPMNACPACGGWLPPGDVGPCVRCCLEGRATAARPTSRPRIAELETALREARAEAEAAKREAFITGRALESMRQRAERAERQVERLNSGAGPSAAPAMDARLLRRLIGFVHPDRNPGRREEAEALTRQLVSLKAATGGHTLR